MSLDPRKTNCVQNNFSLPLPLSMQSKRKYINQSNLLNEIEEAILEETNGTEEEINMIKAECDYNLEQDLFNVENLREERAQLKDILKYDSEDFRFTNLLMEENDQSELSGQEFQNLILISKREGLYKKQFRKNINHLAKKFKNYSTGIMEEHDSYIDYSLPHILPVIKPTNSPSKSKKTTPKKTLINPANYTPSPVKHKKPEFSHETVDIEKHKTSIKEKSATDKSVLFSEIVKKNIPKYQKNLINVNTFKMISSKKTAQNCIREVKKKEFKSLKLEHDSVIAVKKISRSIINYWRERERAEKHYRKKYERKAMEQQKKDIEFLELRRQQQKLNLLITQTELYSHFAGNTPASNITESNIPGSILDNIKSDSLLEKSLNLDDGVLVRPFESEEYNSNNFKQMAVSKVQQAILKQQQNVLLFDDTDAIKKKGLEERLNVANAASDTEITVDPPKLFNGTLKQYQIKGFNWLVSLYHRGINGILADEMGLGKTVQTIAFLAYLAETIDLWGPFLIIAPATTLHNWQNELNHFLPDFRILPYWGNSADRKIFRVFWNNEKHLIKMKGDAPFHIIITSYQLAVRDMKYFQRISWQFLVLDEAQAIKSNTSQRWKTLLSFNCRNRLLLTGTPIQNNLAELWALLHFIMPTLFDNHEEFNEWFSKGIESRVESKNTIDQIQLTRLHMIIKPFILRRTKSEVEHELSEKIEIRLKCALSMQQQILYDAIKNKISLDNLIQISTKTQVKDSDEEFFDTFEDAPITKEINSETRLMNLVMQFRKVCNHPALFERHSTYIPFYIELNLNLDSNIFLNKKFFKNITSKDLNYNIFTCDNIISQYNSGLPNLFSFLYFHRILSFHIIWEFSHNAMIPLIYEEIRAESKTLEYYHTYLHQGRNKSNRSRLMFDSFLSIWNTSLIITSAIHPVYGYATERIYKLNMQQKSQISQEITNELLFHEKTVDERNCICYYPHILRGLMTRKAATLSLPSQIHQWQYRNALYSPSVCDALYRGKSEPPKVWDWQYEPLGGFEVLKPSIGWSSIKYPSMDDFIKDSGKLIVLDNLLFCLKASEHRVLIYSQMTRMMDLLEEYLNYRQYKFIRLDGSSKIDERKEVVDTFQNNSTIFVFLLSTRAGGVGINLTAADTVIFYDSDWNPTVDQQAMDRAHRLGQTRQVTVYRLISSGTVEERMLERATHKSAIQQMVISGNVTSFKTRQFVSLLLDDEVLETELKQKKAESRKRKRDKLLNNKSSKIVKYIENQDIPPTMTECDDLQLANIYTSTQSIPISNQETKSNISDIPVSSFPNNDAPQTSPCNICLKKKSETSGICISLRFIRICI